MQSLHHQRSELSGKIRSGCFREVKKGIGKHRRPALPAKDFLLRPHSEAGRLSEQARIENRKAALEKAPVVRYARTT